MTQEIGELAHIVAEPDRAARGAEHGPRSGTKRRRKVPTGPQPPDYGLRIGRDRVRRQRRKQIGDRGLDEEFREAHTLFAPAQDPLDLEAGIQKQKLPHGSVTTVAMSSFSHFTGKSHPQGHGSGKKPQ